MDSYADDTHWWHRAFLNFIMEEDRPMVEQEWYNLSELRLKRTFEMRIIHKWYHRESGTWKHKWIMASCGQDENEDGSLKSVIGSFTDISLLKQAPRRRFRTRNAFRAARSIAKRGERDTST